jgi:hypothetical protein
MPDEAALARSARTTIILGTDDFPEGTWVSPEISEDG